MPRDAFSHVDTWVFDLDNTLYPPAARLFDQIEVRMTRWVASELNVSESEANVIRRDYWARYGTTLAGLMREHGVAPEGYLVDVHEISLDHLTPDPVLARAIGALPGRRIVYTNGTEPYARRVLAARGLEPHFHAVYGVEHAGFLPKPERAAFLAIIERDGFAPSRAAMFEDDPRNLEEPMALGMKTVLVADDPVEAPHIHHHAPDLAAFLTALH